MVSPDYVCLIRFLSEITEIFIKQNINKKYKPIMATRISQKKKIQD